jgi:hypothetical protein
MPQKTLIRKASNPDKYLVIHPNQAPYEVQAEEQKVKDIIKTAEDDLKNVFDQSGGNLASGVKLGLAELL